jgi:hypothetical protein
MSSAKRKEAISAAPKKLPPRTLNLAPVFEIIDETVADNCGEQVEEICLADSGGPGLGSVRQSLCRQASREALCQYLSDECLAFLQMFVVVIDRERKLA